MIDPFMIVHKTPLHYKFIFKGGIELVSEATQFIDTWLARHGYAAKRGKVKEVPSEGFLEINTFITRQK